MSREPRKYGDKEIRYGTDEEPTTIQIDDVSVEILEEDDGFYTYHLPFQNYDSLDDLAEDLVDHWDEIAPAVKRRQDRDDEPPDDTGQTNRGDER